MDPVIDYGRASLADVLPSCLAALGVADSANGLSLDPAPRIVVLLVDGLGWQLLRENATDAPFLSGLTGRPLTAGCPTTTATSIASLGTGLPSGEHGLTGYTSRLPGLSEPVNWLGWTLARSGRSLLDTITPEQVQPHPTELERAERAGVSVHVVSAPAFRKSGLTRAALRGGSYQAAFTPADLVVETAAAVRGVSGPSLTYCYLSELDLIGHVRGCTSEAWQAQLRAIDRTVADLVGALPAATRLLVTADHGMLDVPDEAKIDYDAAPDLSADVAMLAGEARLRYVHAEPGCLAAVRERWTDRLAGTMRIVERDEAIAAGWFGPRVADQVRERIGELIALPAGNAAVVRRHAESRLSAMIGHHGALSEAELLVPLLQA